MDANNGPEKGPKMSRRDFLKLAGVLVISACDLIPLGQQSTPDAKNPTQPPTPGTKPVTAPATTPTTAPTLVPNATNNYEPHHYDVTPSPTYNQEIISPDINNITAAFSSFDQLQLYLNQMVKQGKITQENAFTGDQSLFELAKLNFYHATCLQAYKFDQVNKKNIPSVDTKLYWKNEDVFRQDMDLFINNNQFSKMIAVSSDLTANITALTRTNQGNQEMLWYGSSLGALNARPDTYNEGDAQYWVKLSTNNICIQWSALSINKNIPIILVSNTDKSYSRFDPAAPAQTGASYTGRWEKLLDVKIAENLQNLVTQAGENYKLARNADGTLIVQYQTKDAQGNITASEALTISQDGKSTSFTSLDFSQAKADQVKQDNIPLSAVTWDADQQAFSAVGKDGKFYAFYPEMGNWILKIKLGLGAKWEDCKQNMIPNETTGYTERYLQKVAEMIKTADQETSKTVKDHITVDNNSWNNRFGYSQLLPFNIYLSPARTNFVPFYGFYPVSENQADGLEVWSAVVPIPKTDGTKVRTPIFPVTKDAAIKQAYDKDLKRSDVYNNMYTLAKVFDNLRVEKNNWVFIDIFGKTNTNNFDLQDVKDNSAIWLPLAEITHINDTIYSLSELMSTCFLKDPQDGNYHATDVDIAKLVGILSKRLVPVAQFSALFDKVI